MSGYLNIDGTSNEPVSTPDPRTVAGTLEVIMLLAADDWSPLAVRALTDQWLNNSDESYYFSYLDGGTGGVNARGTWSYDGTTTINKTSTQMGEPINDGDHLWLRFILDPSVASLSYYFSKDPITTDHTAVSWTFEETDTDVSTGTLHNSARALVIGGSYFQDNFVGKVYGAWYYDGTTKYADPDFRDDTQGWSGGTGTDSHSNAWTIYSGATWVAPGGKLEGRTVHYDFSTKTLTVASGV